MNIIIIGMMGSGKSTVGRLMAKKLDWAFYDCDQIIESEKKMTISEIFQQKGESAFRKIETEALTRLSSQPNCVIATGGGAPTIEKNWESFSKDSAVIWIKNTPENLYQRLKRSGKNTRPLLKDSFSVEKISEILKERECFYRKAGFTVESDGLESNEVAEKILKLVSLNK